MSADLAAETGPQRERVVDAATELETALHALATEAKTATRRIGRRPGPVDITAVVTAYRAVEQAHDAHYIALTDLRTASGDDL